VLIIDNVYAIPLDLYQDFTIVSYGWMVELEAKMTFIHILGSVLGITRPQSENIYEKRELESHRIALFLDILIELIASTYGPHRPKHICLL
jgi:hypothetical protein